MLEYAQKSRKVQFSVGASNLLSIFVKSWGSINTVEYDKKLCCFQSGQFTGIDLSCGSFSNVNFSDCDLSYSNLTDSTFVGCDFSGCNLQNTILNTQPFYLKKTTFENFFVALISSLNQFLIIKSNRVYKSQLLEEYIKEMKYIEWKSEIVGTIDSSSLRFKKASFIRLNVEDLFFLRPQVLPFFYPFFPHNLTENWTSLGDPRGMIFSPSGFTFQYEGIFLYQHI